jgi:hypothetical protein
VVVGVWWVGEWWVDGGAVVVRRGRRPARVIVLTCWLIRSCATCTIAGLGRALAAATPFWTLVNAVSFNLVPVEHRALVASLAAFVWNVYLASTAARGKGVLARATR